MRASAPPSAAEYGLGQMRTTGSAVPAAMTPPQKGVFHSPRVMSAAARGRPGEDEGGERQEGDDLAAAQERAPEPQEGDAAVGDENPRAPDQPGSVVRPDEDVVEALGALEVEHEEGRRREKEEERQGRRGDAEQRDRRQATAEHRDRRDQERAGGDRFREEIRRDPPPPRPRRVRHVVDGTGERAVPRVGLDRGDRKSVV